VTTLRIDVRRQSVAEITLQRPGLESDKVILPCGTGQTRFSLRIIENRPVGACSPARLGRCRGVEPTQTRR